MLKGFWWVWWTPAVVTSAILDSVSGFFIGDHGISSDFWGVYDAVRYSANIGMELANREMTLFFNRFNLLILLPLWMLLKLITEIILVK